MINLCGIAPACTAATHLPPEGRRGTRNEYRVSSVSALGGGEGRGEVGVGPTQTNWFRL